MNASRSACIVLPYSWEFQSTFGHFVCWVVLRSGILLDQIEILVNFRTSRFHFYSTLYNRTPSIYTYLPILPVESWSSTSSTAVVVMSSNTTGLRPVFCDCRTRFFDCERRTKGMQQLVSRECIYGSLSRGTDLYIEVKVNTLESS